MYGCGLRIGEALAVKKRCRINGGTTLRVREQVNPVAQRKPLKFRVEGQFRDIPLPLYVSEAIDKHIADHGTTDDGYLFQGRRHKHVTRRTYNEDFERAAGKAGLPTEFIPRLEPGQRRQPGQQDQVGRLADQRDKCSSAEERVLRGPVRPGRRQHIPQRPAGLAGGRAVIGAVTAGVQAARWRTSQMVAAMSSADRPSR
jgi:hypothetical protein